MRRKTIARQKGEKRKSGGESRKRVLDGERRRSARRTEIDHVRKMVNACTLYYIFRRIYLSAGRYSVSPVIFINRPADIIM